MRSRDISVKHLRVVSVFLRPTTSMMYAPTANVRSVVDFHGRVPVLSVSTSTLWRRDEMGWLRGLVTLKETILLHVCVNKVSIPSALAGDGEVVDALGRRTRDGNVNARRRFGLDAAGARTCSGVFEAGDDMANSSGGHLDRAAVEKSSRSGHW